MEETNITEIDPELQVLLLNKESGFNYRERRQTDWLENYTLYRDKVEYNRLTQRQSVNVPLMKQTIRTLLKDVDDMPVLTLENLDNDDQAQIFLNEYWRVTLEENKADLKDILDKRQVFLYGRSFDQWQVVDGKVVFGIIDPEDILIDRYMDPTNIDSSRFLIHTHIFKPLSLLEGNSLYDQDVVKELKQYYATEAGLIKAEDNLNMFNERNQKMEELGVSDVVSPVLGETYVELSMHFVYHKEPGEEEEQLYLYIECDDMKILTKKPLEEIIGITEDHFWRNHYPYNTWADDVDNQDFWSDGIADIVRTPNKVLNSWISQLVENRTLRNFGMQYYDTTQEGFNPQTFSPIPWGWYGVPGKPTEVVQKVDIPDLSESLDEMTFLIQLIEKATGATATQQGTQIDRQVTLGEVQLALGEAKERVKGMAKFYTPAWQERGKKFLKLIEAASNKLDVVKIYKKGRNSDKLYSREISPSDWKIKSGYRVRVWSQEDKNTQDIRALEKMNAVRANMADNPKVDEIYKRKLVEWADFSPDEVNEVMEYERQKRMLGNQMGGAVSQGGQMSTRQTTIPQGQGGITNQAVAQGGQNVSL
jgi:hypothetical protein